jgi:retinol dehydrogenase-12/retinol dehydrogenase-13
MPSKAAPKPRPERSPPEKPRPVCLVTGATSGIGFEIALGLARAGAQVVLAARDEGRGEDARRRIARATKSRALELLSVDLASQASIRAAARELERRHPSLDVLVNNAGVALSEREIGPDGIERTFATNVLGYHLMTELLLGALKAAPAARIVNVASIMAYGLDLEDVEFKRRPYGAGAAYAQSKQANRMLTWALARRLAGTRVTANAVHPGAVDTPLLHALLPGLPGRTPAEGADTAIWLATSPEVEGQSGIFWSDRAASRCMYRGEAGEEALFQLTERMTRSS